MKINVCILLAIYLPLICSSKVKRQVSFQIPFLQGQNGRPFGFQFGGRPQNQNQGQPQGNRQTVGNVFNSFVNGFLGGNQNRPAPNTQQQGLGGLFNFVQPRPNQNQQRDPCQPNKGGCQHICTVDERNRRRCKCHPGYVLDNDFKSCFDLDECGLLNSPCEHNCDNTEGSFICNCNHGFTLRDDGTTCESNTPISSIPDEPATPAPVESCHVNNGGCEQRCVQRRRGVVCKCEQGLELKLNGKDCIDINECATGRNSCPENCINTIGSYKCEEPILPEPPQPVGPSGSCEVNNGGCEQRCRVNRRGILKCGCRRRFILRDDGVSCQPSGQTNNPCARNNGRCQHDCIFKDGTKKCSCREGYELRNNRRCVKVLTPRDPCQTDNGGCEQICNAVNGHVECDCKLGYELDIDGKFCFLPDPCLDALCEHTCIDVNGQAQCKCDPGYEVDGDLCHLIDPCVDALCDQECRNSGGIAECYCNPGFEMKNEFCEPIPDQPFILPTPPPKLPPSVPASQLVENCGVNPRKSLIRRIVGGKPADPKDWPWMAAILLKNAKSNFCGGTLILPDAVLTAAHCVHHFTKDEIEVRLGEYEFGKVSTESPAVTVEVADIRVHERYNTSTQENDIALLKLGIPITFNKDIFPACLPDPGDSYAGSRGYVTGWGTIYFGGPESTVLQEVVIPVWQDQDCKQAYKDKILPGMMCAGIPEGGKDSCQGDSGGPLLMQKFPSTKWFVAGVVSWGIECASPNRPGVYTRVNEYLPWVISTAQK